MERSYLFNCADPYTEFHYGPPWRTQQYSVGIYGALPPTFQRAYLLMSEKETRELFSTRWLFWWMACNSLRTYVIRAVCYYFYARALHKIWSTFVILGAVILRLLTSFSWQCRYLKAYFISRFNLTSQFIHFSQLDQHDFLNAPLVFTSCFLYSLFCRLKMHWEITAIN